MDKPTLRAELRACRAALRPLVRAQQEDLVNAAMVSDEDWAAADVVALYAAVGTELSVTSATHAAWRAGKTVCFPKVGPGGLSLHRVEGWGGLMQGHRGIPEPADACPLVSPATVDLVVVPGLGWTAHGGRLGQGGGHYDRLLPMIGGASWGVGFDCQVVEDLPLEPHDRPVDRVLWPAALG